MSSRTKLALGITLSLLTPAVAVVGCGGEDAGPGRGTAGTTGSGGSSGATSSGGSAGTDTTTGGSAGSGTATGGTSGGSAGAGGSGGGMTPQVCNASVIAASAPSISDFSVTAPNEAGDGTLWGQALGGDAGTIVDQTQLWGGIFGYGSTTFAVTDEALVVSGEVSDYSGAGLWFGPCVDARAFSGVTFDIGGDVGTTGQITVMLQTNADSPIVEADMRGACAYDPPDQIYSDCAQPGVTKAVSTTSGPVTVTWAELMGGKPSATTDASDLVGIQFQFAWSDTAAPYQGTMTIDNIHFEP